MKKLITMLILAMSFTSYTQWEPDVRLTNDSGESSTSHLEQCITSSGNTVHAVWGDVRNGISKIYTKRSPDDGVSWGVEMPLITGGSSSSVAVSGSVVHLIFGGVHYKRSPDNGISWGPNIQLSIGSRPSVSVFGSFIYVVWKWSSGSEPEVYGKHSTNAGINWSADTQLTNNTSGVIQVPKVSVSGSTVHVVWHTALGGNYKTYYKRSVDGGITWDANLQLSSAGYYPSISTSGSFVHVVWGGSGDGNYKRSTDGGVTWDPNIEMAVGMSPLITASGLNVHIVWNDNRDGNYEIYYKRSTNEGMTWGSDTRLTDNVGESRHPSMTVSGTVVNVIWQDFRDGNWEIYTKRNPTGNPIGIINISSEIPSSYSLKQNFPNPFNPNTNITFDVLRLSDVKLTVFDMLGKEVTTLVNDQLKPGTYVTNWNASVVATGVYFYKLTAGDYSETKKMILVK